MPSLQANSKYSANSAESYQPKQQPLNQFYQYPHHQQESFTMRHANFNTMPSSAMYHLDASSSAEPQKRPVVKPSGSANNLHKMQPIFRTINDVAAAKIENALRNQLRNHSGDENFHAMNEKNYVRRGDLYGPVYDVDHLATFTVGSKHGLLKAEDGMRKLRIMEKSQGIWTMECQIMIDENYLVAFDKRTGQEVELFPLDLLHEPTSVVSDDKKDIYNNILLFTVLEDPRKKLLTGTPSEMHIFQCVRTHSAEIVDEIYRAKEGRRQLAHSSVNHSFPVSQPQQHQRYSMPINEEAFESYRKYGGMMPMDDNGNYKHFGVNGIATNPHVKGGKSSSGGGGGSSYYSGNSADNAPSMAKIEADVQTLNRCFDDIERFVTRLQCASENHKELERRQKQRKSQKKQLGDGMLSLRAQMPPPADFVDVYQKFKYSFNLLAKLKAHIHDPNAPELVHFLFTPLALIISSAKDPQYRNLTKSTWNPLLTKDAKELLTNCLTSKEQDLWHSLGDAWTVCKEDTMKNPGSYNHVDANQMYNPVFHDTGSNCPTKSSSHAYHNQPNFEQVDSRPDMMRYPQSGSSTGPLNHSNASSLNPTYKMSRQSDEASNPGSNLVSKPNGYSQQKPQPQQQQQQQLSQQPQANGKYPVNGSSVANGNPASGVGGPAAGSNGAPRSGNVPSESGSGSTNVKPVNIRNYEEMKKWAIDLSYRGAKVYEVTHDRQANNDKELTIKTGELLEVLDDKRNWWRLRNFHGQVGHAPVTILRQWDLSSVNGQPSKNQGRQSEHDKLYSFRSIDNKTTTNDLTQMTYIATTLASSSTTSTSSASSSASSTTNRSKSVSKFSPAAAAAAAAANAAAEETNLSMVDYKLARLTTSPLSSSSGIASNATNVTNLRNSSSSAYMNGLEASSGLNKSSFTELSLTQLSDQSESDNYKKQITTTTSSSFDTTKTTYLASSRDGASSHASKAIGGGPAGARDKYRPANDLDVSSRLDDTTSKAMMNIGSTAAFPILPSKVVELSSGGHLKVSTENYSQHHLMISPSINLNTGGSSSSGSSGSNQTSSYHNMTKTTLLASLKQDELNDSQSSGGSPIPPAPPCGDLNFTSYNSSSESCFSSEIRSKQKQVIAKVNSIDIVLNDDDERTRAKLRPKRDEASAEKRMTMDDIEPMKDLLHDELMKRMSKERPFFKKDDKIKLLVNHLSDKSTSEEVKNFLISKEFSQKVILMFGELDGAQLFTLNKNDFEKYCGKEEGSRLDSQITVQKSLCGYREKTNELDSILRMRKEKSESMIFH